MKIEAERKQQFNPITISVTLETRGELETIYAMTALDETIPEAVSIEAGNGNARDAMAHFQKSLRLALHAFR